MGSEIDSKDSSGVPDLLGFRQAGSLSLLDAIEEGRTEGENSVRVQREVQRRKATAEACFSVALGVKPEELTPGQREMLKAVGKNRGGSAPRGYGFRIDTRGRAPEKR